MRNQLIYLLLPFFFTLLLTFSVTFFDNKNIIISSKTPIISYPNDHENFELDYNSNINNDI